MVKNKGSVTTRAWRILRLALLWARKGGAFRRWRLMLDLRGVALKSGARAERIRHMERELSFDETPEFNFKMSRISSLRFPKIPCMTAPSVRPDVEDWIFFKDEKECDGCDLDDDLDSEEFEEVEVEEDEDEEGGGIDLKAEEFITKFYEEMKLQREVSWIEYNEMIHGGVN